MGISDIIFFLPPALLGVVAIAFLLLWRLGIVSTWHWSAAFAQAGLGFVISTFPIAPKFDAFVSGMIFVGAACCYSIAIRLHFCVPIPKIGHRLFVAGYTVLLCYFVFGLESLKHQLFLTDFAFACVFGVAVFSVASKARRAADIALVVTAALIVVDTLARTFFFTFFTESSDQLADFADSTYNLAVHLTTITIGLAFPFAALGAMASKAIDRHRDASERDPLTGLLNRRGFEHVAQRKFRADREGAIVICDIDHFKKINDDFGHAAGDGVLIEFAAEIGRVIGTDGSAARFGGEEFIAFLPDTPILEAAALGELLRIRLARTDWQSKGIGRRITASFGIAAINGIDKPMRTAIDRADRALYSAKDLGRNQVVIEGAHRPSARDDFETSGLTTAPPCALRSIA
ncbi:GGDEF domain-containing protein [Ensifer sp. ENS07]|uniref:GGDEF domain-containing protein n=1 Tax=Ensifer sp. ENS07 TaxID=2769274 RepID=UPI00177F7100|nr:GGDEF domain-containing protein [Ensifer sp. ENS07]MBD9639856.1 GGDEF domain-containing protein [Ensifer sp. ENS07]